MEDLAGKQLGPYQVVAPLGEGGMAAVYKAFHPAMERYVALKVLPRHFAGDPEFVARFAREARLLAQLQHPHILPVFDFGQADGYSYLAMPLVETGTLAGWLTGQPLPLSTVRAVMLQLADALGYAHARGLVHRDIKPSNVLVDAGGHCLLTDFGLARMLEGSVNLTASGAILGTPAYMSPEQGQGQPLDARSDLYSLGVVLYELAVGRKPYNAETPMAVMIKHLQDPLPLPRQLNPALPEAVERAILKALAKDPADRYQSAADFAQALRAALPEVEQPEPPPAKQSERRVAAPPGRRSWAGPAVGLGLVGLAVITVWALASTLKPPAASPTHTPETPAATAQSLVTTAAPSAPAPATQTSPPAGAPTPAAAPTSSAPTSSAPTSSAVISAPAEFTGSLIVAAGDYLYRLRRDPDTGQISTTRLPGSNSNWFFRDLPPVAPAPDGQALLYALDDPKRTVILNLETGGQTFIADDEAHCLSWSPDGQRITFAARWEGTYGLYVYTLASRAVDLVYAPPSAAYGAAGRLHGRIECGAHVWIGPDRLLFQAFQGEMPASVTFGNPDELNPNATLLAGLGQTVALSHVDALWQLVDFCGASGPALVRDAGGSYFVAESVTSLADLGTRRLPCDDCEQIGFTLDGCGLYAVQVPGPRLYMLAPATYEATAELTLAAIPQDGVWIGNPMSAQYATLNLSGLVHWVDLASGATVELATVEGFPRQLVAWLPD